MRQEFSLHLPVTCYMLRMQVEVSNTEYLKQIHQSSGGSAGNPLASDDNETLPVSGASVYW